MLVLALWCWGLILFVCDKARVNYRLLLDLPSTEGVAYDVIWSAANFSVLLFACFEIQFKTLRCDFPSFPSKKTTRGFWPLFPLLYLCWKTIFPWSSRKRYWALLWQIVCSPFMVYPVTFSSNFAGNILTSLSKTNADMAYTFCFYFSGDFTKTLGDGNCAHDDGFFKKKILPFLLICPYL